MSRTLIRGRYLVTNDTSRERPILEDGAVLEENGRIQAVGTYGELKSSCSDARELGGPNFLVFPGLVNAHHHGSGLSSSQQGLPEDNLEPKLFRGIARPRPDPYLNTLYACAKMIESGVTCSIHHAYAGGKPEEYLASMEGALRAHEQAGMRVAIAIATRDQNTFVYESDERFIQRLPTTIQARAIDFLSSRDIPVDEYLAVFWELHRRYGDSDSVRVLLGPAGLQWCSDKLLSRVAETASQAGTGIHLHAVESIYQKLFSERNLGCSAIEYLEKLGILGPKTSCAHSVWVTEEDLNVLAETATIVVHNPSSNLRLGCGIAPIIAMLDAGVHVALGMDGTTLNDDDDMLQEMRLAMRLHRPVGLGRRFLSAQEAFSMATSTGARAALFGDEIGRLAEGTHADLVLMKLAEMGGESVLNALGVVEAVLARGKAADIDTVMIGGQIVLEGGRLTAIDKHALLGELASWSSRMTPEEDDEQEQLVSEIEEHMMAFYDDWVIDGHPYYLPNSRV